MAHRRSARGPLVGAVMLALIAAACGGGELPTGLSFTNATTTTNGAPIVSAPPGMTIAPPDAAGTGTAGVGTPGSATDSVDTGPRGPTTTLFDQSDTAPRVQWRDDDGFLLGANLPWHDFGCDFGCGEGARGGTGVSADAAHAVVAEALERGSAGGMDVVRWWVFPGEPWQITSGSDGLPNGITPTFYDDFDAALALGDFFDISYVFTLFSGPVDIPDRWLTTEPGRQRLADTLGELFARYADHPRIMTWQLVNEPEWQMWNSIVEIEDVQDLATKVNTAIHENSNALASIGSAHLGGIDFWSETGVDYYTAHWYDPMARGIECAICSSYSAIADTLDIDRPIVIGEYYAGEGIDVAERVESLYLKGFAGAFAWSLLPDQTTDQFAIDLDAIAAFAEARSDDLNH